MTDIRLLRRINKTGKNCGMKLVGSLLATVVLFACSGPPNAAAEAQMASGFFTGNKHLLERLIDIANEGRIPARIEPGEPFEGCSDRPCVERGRRMLDLLKEIKAILLVTNEQCFELRKCGISVVIDRQGIGVSGSGTELLYDEAPSWGSFVIHPLKDAPHWFYRHLGD